MKLALLVAMLSAFFYSASAETKGPIVVAVIDSGLDLTDPRFKKVLCASGHRDFTGTGLTDVNGHGTNIAGLIAKHAGGMGYCLMIVKYYLDADTGAKEFERSLEALAYATKAGASIINYSAGGPKADREEERLIRSHPEILFVVAAGNLGQSLDDPKIEYFPASYHAPNMVVVGNLGRDGLRAKTSNYGFWVTTWEVGVDQEAPAPRVFCRTPSVVNCTYAMSGTSQATAVHTGKLVREWVGRH